MSQPSGDAAVADERMSTAAPTRMASEVVQSSEGAADDRSKIVRVLEELEVLTFTVAGEKVDVGQPFGTGSVTSLASRVGLHPGVAIDLVHGWDLSTPEGRERATLELTEHRPRLLVISPPCSSFSIPQHLVKDSERKAEARSKGEDLHAYAVQQAKEQVRQGGYFLYEQPWSADSWKLKGVQELMNLNGIELYKGHQCVFGQETVGRVNSEVEPALKPTGWLTNAHCIGEALSKRFQGQHVHGQLLGRRAAQAAIYPPKLGLTILRALRRQLVEDGGLQELTVGETVEEAEMTVENGDHMDIDGTGEVYDDVTGLPLDPAAVKAAENEELRYMEQTGVFSRVTIEEARRRVVEENTGQREPIRCRWVRVNKGDK